MVISGVLRHLLFIALCIPVIAKADTPIATGSAVSANAWSKWTDMLPSKYTLGAASLGASLAVLFFAIPALSKKVSFNVGLGGHLKSIYNHTSCLTNYVKNTASVWFGWGRSLLYNVYDAPINMQAVAYDHEKTNTCDVLKQAEVFGKNKGMSLPDAIAAGNLKIVKQWLEKDPGLQVQVLIENETGDSYGRNGAMLAAKWGRDEVFKLFLRQTQVDKVDDEGKTALHHAMITNRRLDNATDEAYTEQLKQEDAKRADIIQKLINSQANLHIADKTGNTPLAYLAQNMLFHHPIHVFFQALKNNAHHINEGVRNDLVTALKIAIDLENTDFVKSFKKYLGMKYFDEQLMKNASEEIQNIVYAPDDFTSQQQAFEQAQIEGNTDEQDQQSDTPRNEEDIRGNQNNL